MAYATLQNLIDRLGQSELVDITDKAAPPLGQVDQTRVAEALDDTDALINSYIAVRVATPLSPVPRVLIPFAVAIARYKLWADRASEKVQKDYDAAIKWLGQVRDGEIALGEIASAETTPASGGSPAIAEGCHVFSDEALKGFA